jgi:hypothetical protein
VVVVALLIPLLVIGLLVASPFIIASFFS